MFLDLTIVLTDVSKDMTDWLIENDIQSRFTNKELYERWGKSDVEYYALIEVRIPEYIPVEFIKGYIKK